MNKIITSTGRSIGTITAEIVAISNQAAQMAYMSMVEIGRRLVEAKELVPHGEWGDYLKNEVKFSHRTANNFMQIYERANGTNSQTFANLGYSHIVKLLALPDEELTEFAETHDVHEMSVRQLDQAIKERDEARRLQAAAEDEKAAAQAAARDAEHQLLDLQQKATAAKSSEDAWKQEIDKLTTALNKATAAADNAKKQVKDLKENPQFSQDQHDKLFAAAKAAAAEVARAEIQAQLDAANQAADAARKEKAVAEEAAMAAQAQLAELRKSAQLSHPDVQAFRLLGKQIAAEFNQMAGYRMKVGAKDPEMDAKMQGFMLELANRLRTIAGKSNRGGDANVASNQ